jgi:hydroxyethylthiazole kinase
MLLAANIAKELGKPIVLDPVGAGASKLRTDTCKKIIHTACPDIIRGNASEIMALMDSSIQTKGVDSTHEANEALDIARALSTELNNTIAVTGKIDYIVSNGKYVEVKNGSALMGCVTGMGCTATAIIGAFAGVADNPFEAASSALSIMGIAGEMASAKSEGPGSFQMNFYDSLYTINEEVINSKLKMKLYEA